MNYDNAIIAARIAAFVLALGFVGYVLWTMPILELLQAAWFVTIIPCLFLFASGWITKETVHFVFFGGSKVRVMVNEYMNK